MINAVEIAKGIRLNNDNGLCCARSMGDLCYEHGELAQKIQDAYNQGVKEANHEAYTLGWNCALKELYKFIESKFVVK